MGTSSLWKYLTDNEVRDIANQYYGMADNMAACKELIDIFKRQIEI